MSERVKIYDASTIDQLPWPQTPSGRQAEKFLVPFIKNGPEHYIDNARTQMVALVIDDHVFPVTISDHADDNSYVCSPYTQYIRYGVHEVNRLSNKYLRSACTWVLQIVGHLFQAGGLDRVIMVNNWLFSTNLHPTISEEQVSEITKTLSEKYPDYAIVFRSINPFHTLSLLTALKQSNFEMIPSRQVYITDTKEEEAFRSRMFKSDRAVLKKTPYSIVPNPEILESDISRVRSLYDNLNIQKYSPFNPQLNDNFFQLAVDQGLLKFRAWKKDGKVDAILGFFENNGVVTSPIFGYDMSLPQETGLYRQIATELALEAKKSQSILNHSSGAGSFKKLRRAKPHIEYTAVYVKHLPLVRKLPWKVLKLLMKSIGIPLIRKF